MDFPEISKLLEKRRNDLIALLESNNAELKLEKQHQIYGAINEIEIFLQTLNYYRDREIKDEISDLKLARPSDDDNVFRKVLGNFKGIFRNNKQQ
jgi:hypothetical protein